MISMTEAQEFARKRNWTKMRLVGFISQLKGMSKEDILCEEESKKLEKVSEGVEEILEDWDKNYQLIKDEQRKGK